jgi:hypothetical protein
MIIYTERHEPVSVSSIEATCEKLGFSKGSWIAGFWKESNGAILNDQVLIYSVDDIAERNETFEIDLNFKEMIAIGDDSGGRAILIKKNGEDGFFLVDTGSSSLSNSDRFGSLDQLLVFLLSEQDDADEEFGDIITTGGSRPTLEDVVGIKKMLGVGFSIVQLKSMLSEAGHTLLSSVYSQKYRDALVRFSNLIRFK